MTERNEPCWCGSQKKFKHCHWPKEQQNSFEEQARRYWKQHRILLKTPVQIEGIKRSCKAAASILNEVCQAAKAGVTTNELNSLAEKLYKQHGTTAATVGYGSPPFPKSICTSLNEVICHGIPNDTPLKEGDILNIDVTTILNGFYGDCSRMVLVGSVSPEKRHVSDVAYQCLMRSIAILKPGLPLCQIGEAISDYAEAHGCSVVHQFVAHGVGVHFHEEPQIMHSRNENQTLLAAGMTFTIEPMINLGLPEAIIDPRDGWTARTVDGKPSAQWEHTLLITESGHEILTLP